MTEILHSSARGSAGSRIPRFFALVPVAFALGAGLHARAEAVQPATGFLQPASPSMLSASLFPAPDATVASQVLVAELSSSSLPEAPTPQLATDPKPKHGTDPSQKIARKSTKVIPSDWHAQRLSTLNKAHVALDGIFSVENLASTVIAAGYEHVVNGEPNYGTNSEAFAQRFGAAALRGTTQTAFSDMVFAPLLHEDPRYYVKGPQYSPLKRAVYAATRPLITRKDNGETTVNGSLLLGYAAAAALTPAYYPQINRNFHDVASVYGGSIGGAALGFALTEFSEDLLRSLHLTHLP